MTEEICSTCGAKPRECAAMAPINVCATTGKGCLNDRWISAEDYAEQNRAAHERADKVFAEYKARRDRRP